MKENGVKLKRTKVKNDIVKTVDEDVLIGHTIDADVTNKNSQQYENPNEDDVKEDRFFFCDQCEYETKWNHALKLHIQDKHEGVQHECDMCGKKFNIISSLNYHKKSEHEGVIYQCEVCSKEFKYLSHLGQHQRAIHEGVKYPCTYCSYQATQNYNLLKHILKVHGMVMKIENPQQF